MNQPNLWAGLMRFVCDLLILMYVVGNPFYRFVSELAVTLCHTLLDLSLSLSLSLLSARHLARSLALVCLTNHTHPISTASITKSGLFKCGW